MLTLFDEQAHLLAANDRLRTAVYLIAVQEARVVERRATGLDAALCEELLDAMHETLRNFIAHRQGIIETIESGPRRLGPVARGPARGVKEA